MLANPDAQSGAGAGDESYGNSAPGGSDAHQFGIDSMTRHGDDMHSKGSVKRLRVNGGENPLQEGLVERLQSLYDTIKEASEEQTVTENGLQRYTGIKKYGKKGFEALQKAGRNGADEEAKGRIKDKFNKKKKIRRS
jgi:ClpP class serine protease